MAEDKIKVTQEQAFVVFYYDLAIHMLSGMANQLMILKQESPARQILRVIETLGEKRDGFLKNTEARIVPAGVVNGSERQ